MNNQDEAYWDDYDYHQHTGELAEYFEDEEVQDEDVFDTEQQPPIIDKAIMSNIKLKYLSDLTEIHSAAAIKYGVELRSFVFRSINDCLTLYMEFVSIAGRRHRGDLTINAVLYDKEGDVFNSQTEFIEASYFKGFIVVKFEFDDILPSDVGHIVIHMQKD